ncbi:hypothetical protein CBR_g39264 [Chara braunii]|uniref:Cytosol aminopeptidase domain-containing protein n=1 Tax=Chara braunii TaxID=69332 RepID=A0A388K0Z9_CHABU|nr:hypothetical protein CBR_g39264 [Chara braunii]|eukprot:GBG63722.1 hypothetical protein CBR_g39264 [Chara braunii]
MGSFSAAAAESVALLRAGTRGGVGVVRLTAAAAIDTTAVDCCRSSAASELLRRCNDVCTACSRQFLTSVPTKSQTNLSGRPKTRRRVFFPATHGLSLSATSASSSDFSGLPHSVELQALGLSSVRSLPRRRCFTTAAMAPSTAAIASPPPREVSLETLGLTKAGTPLIPAIRFAASLTSPLVWVGDVLVLLVWEETIAKDESSGKFLDSELASIDDSTGGLLAEIVAEGDFKGKAGQSVFARLGKGTSGLSCKRVGVVGLGKRKSNEDLETGVAPWRTAGSVLAATAKSCNAHSAAAFLLGSGDSGWAGLSSNKSRVAAAKGLSSGLVLGCFEDTRFKSESKKLTLESLQILGIAPSAELDAAFQTSVKICDGIMLTRQLVNAPPNVLTPGAFADVAVAIATNHADVMSATILEKSDCERLGMGAFLGVAAASTLPPKFVHLKYVPPSGKPTKRLAIIGKALTFDSGGYNIKAGVGSMIELMKFDMAGAGAVLGAADAIGSLKPEGVEIHFIAAACENMVSGSGMRPGDILTASNGKTIEVNNTDAEGRLTLADALVYACNLEVDAIVDIATLTGACIVALGNDIGGMFTPHDSIADELQRAAKLAGEKLWRLPMEEAYMETIKSSVADMLNTGGRAGGSIIAALFLKEFVREGIPWAHLDVAGPVWDNKKSVGTGFAVATLVEWASTHSSGAS